jgi:hypothetical protein
MKYVVLILLVGMASAQHCRKIDIDKSSGFCTVLDPALTPGDMDPRHAYRMLTDLAASRIPRRTQSSERMDIQQIQRNRPTFYTT